MCSHRCFNLGRAALAILAVAWLLPGALARAGETTPPPGSALSKTVDRETAKPAIDAPKAPDAAVAKEPAKAPDTATAKETAVEMVPPASHKLRFQFRFQPWKDVLDWFARQADLSLVMDAPPQGTFNYSDNREYTPAEAIDLLNGVLLTKGYTLIRRNRLLMLINLEDGIPPNLVSTVPLEAIDGKGEFEVVRVLFNLEKLKPEEAEVEIRKLLGPQGAVVSFGKSRQVLVTETAGRLRAIRALLARIEGPEGAASAGFRVFELRFVRSDEVLPILRQLFDIPEDKNSAADGSVRIAVEAGSGRLLVSGQPEKVARVVEILKGLDVPAPGTEGAGRMGGMPQLEVYSVAGADPQSVLSVLQTLLAGQPDIRLLVDPKTNNLVAMARPAQHATIRATLAQLQRDAQRVEVIRLARLDPETAATSINKLFSSGDAGKGTAPQVDANPASRQLMIRGNEAQISQIRGLLEKMGEVFPAGGDATQGGRVRTLPYSSSTARSALERIQEIWPTVRPNKIRIVSPSAVNPPAQPGSGRQRDDLPPELLNRLRELKRSGEPPEKGALPGETPGEPKPEPPELPKPSPAGEHSAELPYGARVVFVAEQPAAKTPAEPNSPAPIVVVPGPHGLIIASDDTEALDEFERLLDMLAGDSAGGRAITVFYIKYAKAAAVTESLAQILGGGATSAAGGATSSGSRGDSGGGAPSGDSGGGPFGDGGPFGGFGGRFGDGRRSRSSGDGSSASNSAAAAVAIPKAGQGGLATGSIKITSDQRLNALLVQANQADLDTIEQLLKILDQKESPEDIFVAPKPRMIAVQHTNAQEIADIVKQVYADRMVQGAAASSQPTLPFFMMGRGERGESSERRQSRTSDDAARIAIGVDTRTNSLIVAAPEALFQEVRQLVDQLDVAAGGQNQTVRVVTLRRTSPTAVERALAAIAGDSVQVNHAGGSATAEGRASSPSQPSREQPQGYSWRSRYGSSGQQPGVAPGYNPPTQSGSHSSRRGSSSSGQFPQPAPTHTHN